MPSPLVVALAIALSAEPGPAATPPATPVAKPKPRANPTPRTVTPEVTMEFTSISLTIRPAGPGMAFCTLEKTGHGTGGHLSGDSPPFVHQDEKQFPPEVVAEAWAAARALGPDLLGQKMKPDPSWPGHRVLDLVHADGTTTSLAWRADQDPSDARVKRLADVLYRHHTGGW